VKYPKIFFLILIVGGILFSCQRKEEKKPVYLARVGNATLTLEELNEMIPGEFHATLTLQERKELVGRWVNTELFYQAALKRGLDKEKQMMRRLRDAQREILASELVQREIVEKLRVTEEMARSYFNAHKSEYESTVRLQHILLSSEEEARTVLEELAKGADFATLAKEKSSDPSSSSGGDLGYLRRGEGMLPLEIEEVAFSLEKGKLSGIVKSGYGYHILKVMDRRPLKEKANFDRFKDQLMNTLTIKMQQEALNRRIEELRKQNPVETHLELLGTGSP